MQLQASASFVLPYAHVTEPLMVYFDGKNNQERIEYYNGMDIYYMWGNRNLTKQVNPMGMHI